MSSQLRFGVPAAVTMAQAILESGWGQSKLFLLANNPFGIKYSDSSPDAKYGAYVAPTHEFVNGHDEIVKAGFQHFADLHDAFRLHALLLLTDHYRRAFAVRTDAFAYARALSPDPPVAGGCGYATDPNYGEKLIELIKDEHLIERAQASIVPHQDGPLDASQPRKQGPSTSQKSSDQGLVVSDQEEKA